MSSMLENPGDVLEGRGLLLKHGQFIANVEYHLAIPTQTHFLINPAGGININYKDHIGGFILVASNDAKLIQLTHYTLELANKHKRQIYIERRYQNVTHKGETCVSFWINVVPPP